MKVVYDRDFHPPAPMIPVTVRVRADDVAHQAIAKLDSGADLSGVPRALLERVGARPIRVARAAGFAGELMEVLVYRLDLRIDEAWVDRVEVLATLRPYVLVGRNVLASFVLRLDGPRGRLELRRPTRTTAPPV